MTKPKSPETPRTVPNGLILRGTVQKRWRKVLESGTEIVNYDVDGVTLQEYSPNGKYFAIGEFLEVPIRVNAYNGKNGVRYTIVHANAIEGEF